MVSLVKAICVLYHCGSEVLFNKLRLCFRLPRKCVDSNYTCKIVEEPTFSILVNFPSSCNEVFCWVNFL